MGKVYTDIEAEIPSEAIVCQSSKRVYIVTKKVYVAEKHYNIDKRLTIGRYVRPGFMNPNDNYKMKYPAEWESLTKTEVRRSHKKVGLYGAVSAITSSYDIYFHLKRIFGEKAADALLDYAIFMIGAHSDATEQYSSFMADHATFSHEVRSDSWYSEFFKGEINGKDMTAFKDAWAAKCKELGVESVYLCIDGSNNDCSASGVEFAEKGHSKSAKDNQNIVSYMYAVSEDTGIPVTYNEYRGGAVDSKAIKEVITYLEHFGFHIKGVTLDRAFCVQPVIDYLDEHKINYVVKLKGAVVGTQSMMEKHARNIKWNVRRAIPGTAYFGITDQGRIFKTSTHDNYLHLYFDWKNGGDRAMTLITGVQQSCAKALEVIRAGKEPVIPIKYAEYIAVSTPSNPDEQVTVTVNYDRLQKAVDEKGYTALASSESLTAAEANKKYDLRNNSEVCYKFIKSHLGFSVARVQSESSLRAKFFECFLASIIRHFIVQSAKATDLSTNVILRELSLLEMHLLPGDIYTMIHTENKRQLQFLQTLGMDAANLDAIADTENRYIHGDAPRRRKRKTGPKRGSHHLQFDEDGNVIRRKPGPKPGSHHKTLALKKDGTPKLKPGPKVGSHHKKAAE